MAHKNKRVESDQISPNAIRSIVKKEFLKIAKKNKKTEKIKATQHNKEMQHKNSPKRRNSMILREISIRRFSRRDSFIESESLANKIQDSKIVPGQNSTSESECDQKKKYTREVSDQESRDSCDDNDENSSKTFEDQNHHDDSINENEYIKIVKDFEIHKNECVRLIKDFEGKKNREYKTMIFITAISIFIAFCLAAKVIFDSNSFEHLKFSKSGVEIPFPIYMVVMIAGLLLEESILAKNLFFPNQDSTFGKCIKNKVVNTVVNTALNKTQVLNLNDQSTKQENEIA